MLTFEEVVGPWFSCDDLTAARIDNIRNRLLPAVWALEKIMHMDGVDFPINPATRSSVSGQTFGGFRPQSCPIGAPHSNHKEGLAVDRYDPHNAIDAWCMAHLDTLRECGIYLEHPDATPGWSHWQCVPPKSGRIVFRP